MFSDIFRALDSDQDDLITADAMSLTTLPSEILKLLEPLFKELEMIEEGINF